MEASVTAGAAPTSAVDTFNHFFLPQVLGDPADTGGCKVVVSRLYAAQAAKTFITWLQKDSRKHCQCQNTITPFGF
jgi:hypothetical protein